MLLIVVLTQPLQEKCLPVCKACGRTTHTTDYFFPASTLWIHKKEQNKGENLDVKLLPLSPF